MFLIENSRFPKPRGTLRVIDNNSNINFQQNLPKYVNLPIYMQKMHWRATENSKCCILTLNPLSLTLYLQARSVTGGGKWPHPVISRSTGPIRLKLFLRKDHGISTWLTKICGKRCPGKVFLSR